MSASEKLKALNPSAFPVTTREELLHVFPQIVAVVEAAEMYAPFIWRKDDAEKLGPVLRRRLAALEEALT